MPWQLESAGNGRYNVVKQGDGKIVGHNLPKKRASAMMKALYANVKEPERNSLVGNKIQSRKKFVKELIQRQFFTPEDEETLQNMRTDQLAFMVQNARLVENTWSPAARAAAKNARRKFKGFPHPHEHAILISDKVHWTDHMQALHSLDKKMGLPRDKSLRTQKAIKAAVDSYRRGE